MSETASTATAGEPLDPMREALRWSSICMPMIGRNQELDEESYTAMFLSGLTYVVPVLSTFFGKQPADQTQSSWGLFKKSASQDCPFSESASGADLCFVIGNDRETALVALVQAKKTETAGARTLDVTRSPSKAAQGNTQLAMLAALGCRMMASEQHPDFNAFQGDATTLAAAQRLKELTPDKALNLVRQLDWVHYLMYRGAIATSIPMNALDQAAIFGELGFGARASHQLNGKYGSPFADVINGGLGGTCLGWLTLRRESLPMFLPELLALGIVIVGDGRGGRNLTPHSSLALTPGIALSATAEQALSNGQLWTAVASPNLSKGNSLS